jgi:excisionase family DNA binding protein
MRFDVEQIYSDPRASRTLVDVSELSRRLSIAKGTLYNWVYLRRIPYVKAGRCLRFNPDEVLESLHQCPTI